MVRNRHLTPAAGTLRGTDSALVERDSFGRRAASRSKGVSTASVMSRDFPRRLIHWRLPGPPSLVGARRGQASFWAPAQSRAPPHRPPCPIPGRFDPPRRLRFGVNFGGPRRVAAIALRPFAYPLVAYIAHGARRVPIRT
jgi:hypothetical protein